MRKLGRFTQTTKSTQRCTALVLLNLIEKVQKECGQIVVKYNNTYPSVRALEASFDIDRGIVLSINVGNGTIEEVMPITSTTVLEHRVHRADSMRARFGLPEKDAGELCMRLVNGEVRSVFTFYIDPGTSRSISAFAASAYDVEEMLMRYEEEAEHEEKMQQLDKQKKDEAVKPVAKRKGALLSASDDDDDDDEDDDINEKEFISPRKPTTQSITGHLRFIEVK